MELIDVLKVIRFPETNLGNIAIESTPLIIASLGTFRDSNKMYRTYSKNYEVFSKGFCNLKIFEKDHTLASCYQHRLFNCDSSLSPSLCPISSQTMNHPRKF